MRCRRQSLAVKKAMPDLTEKIQSAIATACEEKTSLDICGGRSKSFFGCKSTGQPLDVSGHTGIISYQPEELVITARAGTPLALIEQTLGENNQALAAEPLLLGASSTLGGAIASGLNGAGSYYRASLSDHVLGGTIVNGKGERLGFGGTVIKNVAGYDISRLLVGSMGCLAVISEISMRVEPIARHELSAQIALPREEYQPLINSFTAKGYPVSASVFANNAVSVRFCAGAAEIECMHTILQRDFNATLTEGLESRQYWDRLRTLTHDFFSGEENLWFITVKPSSPIPEIDGNALTEWNGARRWFYSALPASEVHALARRHRAEATLFRAVNKRDRLLAFSPLPPALMQWYQTIKNAFDPHSVFNRDRMYEGL